MDFSGAPLASTATLLVVGAIVLATIGCSFGIGLLAGYLTWG